ncbi:MAG: DNA primase [Bacteroidales bacterium]|nr:DNA primase [Bacteroidales bacterium]
MIDRDTLGEIKYRSDIVSVAQSLGLNPKKKGRLWLTVCPFHDDHTPSLNINQQTGTFHCYVCDKHGDVFDLVQEIRHCDFIEAAKMLAKSCGVEIKEDHPRDESEVRKEKELLEANRIASEFFISKLDGSALEYTLSRFEEETVKMWGIGYAPKEWHALRDHLKQQGISWETGIEAGLLKKGDKGNVYDVFRGRVVFPIRDIRGRVVAFSGRDITGEEGAAKYLNSPETPVYKKSRTLMGLDTALQGIRKYDVCILVEGNADVVKMHQIGINNTVAACGTALTEDHLSIIGKFTRNVALLYDSDNAGQAAAMRSAEMITKAGLNAVILTIPNTEDGQKQDPDTYFQNKEQFKTFYNSFKKSYWVQLAEMKADNCENDALYKSKTIREIAKLFYLRRPSETAAIIDELSEIIPTKALWNKAIKDMKENDKEVEREQAASERSARQNEMYTKYGFYEKDHCYWFHNPKGEGMFEGSNFVMEPLFHIESTINAKRLYRMTNTYNVTRVVEFPQKDLISLAAFKLRCESLGNFLFNGGEYGLAKIKSYLYEQTQTCKEVTQMGWQKQGFWAWANGIFDGQQYLPITDDGICKFNGENFYIPALSSFYRSDDTLYKFERKFAHKPGKITLYQWLDLFTRVYKDNAIVGFSFYVATLFRDIIVSQFRFFPILNIFGVKGSGKSEMAVSLTNLFGDLPVGLNMTNATIAAMADHVAQTRNALCHIDEYKNSIEYDKVEFLKGLWDGTGRNRMNMDKDKKKEMTAVDAGIILTGQEMPKADIALFSRVIFTAFAKSIFTDGEKKLFNELKEVEKEGLTHITNEILGHRKEFAAKYRENFEAAGSELEKWVEKNGIEDRIWRNWMVVIAALRTIREFIELPFSYEKAVEKMASMISNQNTETLKDNEVNTFWEIFSFLAKDGSIEEDYDYKILHVTSFRTNKVDMERTMRVLVIDKTRVLQLYNKHCKISGIKAIPLSTLKFYLQNSPDYLGEKVFKMKRRIERLQDKQTQREDATDYMNPTVQYRVISTRADCFNYDALGIDIENEYSDLEEF